jgi:hypothetical protein
VIAETTPSLDYSVVYISTEDMTQGETYTLTAGSYSESITLSDLLYSTLNGGMGGSFGGGRPRGGMNSEMNGDTDGQMGGQMNGGMHGGPGGGMRGDPDSSGSSQQGQGFPGGSNDTQA